MIKKVFFRIISLSLFVLIITGSSCRRETDYQKKVSATPSLFDEKGALKEEILELLQVFNVEHDGTLKSIVAQTQKHWLRQTGKERWEIEDIFDHKRELVMPLFEKLQVLGDIRPTKKKFAYALLLGATVYRVRSRLAYLIRLWNDGVRFEELVFLGAQRPLDPVLECNDVLFDRTNNDLAIRHDWEQWRVAPQTETEMMKMVFDQVQLSKTMNDISVTFVDAPMKTLYDGSLKRPTTSDTIQSWLQTKPESGDCLAFSCQPHVGYQHTVLRTFLPKNFFVETVGASCNPKSIKIVVLLDMVARWLYQERKRLDKSD